MNKRYEMKLLVISLLAGIIGIYLLVMVSKNQSLWIDDGIFSVFNTSNKTIITIFSYITELGSKIGIGVVALLTILLLWMKKKDYEGMATVALAVGLGNELNNLIKDWIKRPRPELEQLDEVASFSFPSGHAMVGIILYMLIAYFLVKYIPFKVGKYLAVFICTISIILLGISRIVLQVHFPSDVIAGYAFGFIWGFLWILIYIKIKNWTGIRS